MISAGNSDIWEAIDRTCLLVGTRAAGRAGELAGLYQAARRMARGPLCATTARRLDAALSPGAAVLLLTGAAPRPSQPRGETDGPPGAAVLARALAQGYGARPIVVAEAKFRLPILAALDALAGGSRDAEWRSSVHFAAFPVRRHSAEAAAATLWNHTKPAALIAIERLGPNALGIIHNASGVNITAAHGGLETLFALARRRKVLTIGVGDRGNELGFGAIMTPRLKVPAVSRACACPCRTNIACAVPADLVIVSSVSNWGVYGLAAGLAIRLADPRLIHRPADETRMLKASVMAGARDGLSGRAGLTVDGLSLEMQRTVVTFLGETVARMTRGST